ncbi:MAG: response regulator [Myxococcales bacterium]
MADTTLDLERLADDELLAPCLIHEIRHPLTGALAGLQFLEKSLLPTPEAREDYLLVRNQLARLEELLRSYQDFFQSAASDPHDFAVEPVVARASDLLGFRIRRCGPRFSIEAPKDLQAHATPHALLHALTNLLVNALDSLEEGGNAGRLLVRVLARPDGRVQVRVSDEGKGITGDVLPKLFERGFTTKPPGKGTGLGLTVARRMIESCKGSVQVAGPTDPLRAPWARAEFVVDLPASRAALAAAAQAPVQPPPAALAPASKGPTALAGPAPARALVVDDEAIIVLLLRKALKLEPSVQATFTESAQEAEKLLATQSFDLLITDKNMPGRSGVELAKIARSANPRIGVILITAYASAESAEEMLALGIDEYLTKPFEIDYLLDRVKQVVEGRRSQAGGVPAPSAKRAVLAERDPALRARLVAGLEKLGWAVLPATEVLEGLKATPPPEAVIASAEHFSTEAKSELFRQRMRRPSLAVALIGEPTSLVDTMAAIGVGARLRISRQVDDAGLEKALAELVAGPAGQGSKG